MTRLRFLLIGTAVAMLAAGCQTATSPGTAEPTPPPTIAGPADVPAEPIAAPAGGGAAAASPSNAPATGSSARAPAAPASPYRVTYGWAVPAHPVLVSHQVAVPVAAPPAVPLPLLVDVRAADHPDENFTRITFAFRGGTPSYEVGYVPSVASDGSGKPLPLTGNAFVRIQFTPAQAHDNQGHPTVTVAPRTTLAFPTLRGYGFGSDFEGYVTYGLGLQVAVDSDQVLPVRLGELVRADGTHVVAVDVAR